MRESVERGRGDLSDRKIERRMRLRKGGRKRSKREQKESERE